MSRKQRIVASATSGVAVVLLFLALAAYWATHHVPQFYRQALDAQPEMQKRANDEALENASALANNVRKPGNWYSLFTEDQINGWLAVDLQRNFRGVLPDSVQEPRVHLEDGRARIACRYQDSSLSTVVTVAVDVYLVEANVLAIRIHQARAGVVPVPMTSIIDGLSDAAERLDLRVQWRQANGDPVALVTLPGAHDEHTVYQLDTLQLRQGELYLAGRTTPFSSDPHEQPSHDNQSTVADRSRANVNIQQ